MRLLKPVRFAAGFTYRKLGGTVISIVQKKEKARLLGERNSMPVLHVEAAPSMLAG